MFLAEICQRCYIELRGFLRSLLKESRMLNLKKRVTKHSVEYSEPDNETIDAVRRDNLAAIDAEGDRRSFVDYERSGAVSVRLGEYLRSPAGQKQLGTLKELRRRELTLVPHENKENK